MDEQQRDEVYTKAHNLSMIAQESAVVSLLICISRQLEELIKKESVAADEWRELVKEWRESQSSGT